MGRSAPSRKRRVLIVARRVVGDARVLECLRPGGRELLQTVQAALGSQPVVPGCRLEDAPGAPGRAAGHVWLAAAEGAVRLKGGRKPLPPASRGSDWPMGAGNS